MSAAFALTSILADLFVAMWGVGEHSTRALKRERHKRAESAVTSKALKRWLEIASQANNVKLKQRAYKSEL